MKSQLAASFGGVADRERKHRDKKASGYEIPGHPGKGMVGRSWAGWPLGFFPLGYPSRGLAGRSWAGWFLGLIPLGYPGGGLAGRSWAGWLLGLIPLGLLGWAGWLGVSGLGPWCPQCPPFPAREEDHPWLEKKNKLDRHIYREQSTITAA